MLGAHFAQWTYSLTPAECETVAAYVEAYCTSKSATQRLISLPTCILLPCSALKYSREMPGYGQVQLQTLLMKSRQLAMAELLYNLQYVRRTFARTTHATVLLMPSQAFIRHTFDHVMLR